MEPSEKEFLQNFIEEVAKIERSYQCCCIILDKICHQNNGIRKNDLNALLRELENVINDMKSQLIH
ncbi:hypothetical protein F9883_16760 [Morganella morganii]|uniref:hypothetical protein n=1 Tax=Morganella morganii TaxID=582 RepID=UPI0015F7841D|nr:hypothetical protein [Morganella morganii]MBA5809521.1 hypothetical protein [Morganella morganii]